MSFKKELMDLINVSGLDDHDEIKLFLKQIEDNIEKYRKINLQIENRENKELCDIYNYDLIFKYIMDRKNDNT